MTLNSNHTPEAVHPNSRLSAATARHRRDDSENELYTRFRYEPVQGLGYEEGINRRDPSTIIKVGELYYVWYTRCTDPKYKWLNTDLWYATSLDGRSWTEHGPAVERGLEGDWDDFSVFTCNILVADGMYYLCYQARSFRSARNVVGMAKACSPGGPWEKLPEPILQTTPDGKLIDEGSGYANWSRSEEKGPWDSGAVHDPGILPRFGTYWLYYKGHQIGSTMPADSKWGVAVADNPEGPYVKHPLNPITNSGHEIWVWPWKSGVAAIVDWAGPEKDTVQYSENGVNFDVVAALEDVPPAGRAYIPDKFTDPVPRHGTGYVSGGASRNRTCVPRPPRTCCRRSP
ncbi:MAG: family 43 glycosylhydrolase [Lentisphaerae bacterium]|jgi:hypothetical protein|nr:family 43 glycosylhydrolase [Lentisphaerota bacterium]MBT4821059.1 family 43 glycosylhydrolase [Lentisphaerota bacterium]MBT5609382.1 family 43 glycosylhydrolase [Lentisphaerota bacterium]MBT7060794.1 family 43 glycosylhydrolase [Lentisphaerota bacterium]MBT7843491.1 family 43 glycosylhydrolase [Lentisphaerota bacterium]